MSLKRRKFIRIISYLVALSVVFAVSGISSEKARADYEGTLERVRLESLNSLTEYAREMSSGLRLLAVSADDSLTDSAAYVCARAVGATGCLGSFNSEKIYNISTFLSGAYDFAESFSGNEESRKTAVMLSDYSLALHYHLSDLTNAVMGGEYSLSEHGKLYKKDHKPYFEDILDFENGNEAELFRLISPTSSVRRNYTFLDGLENVSAEDAKEEASRATGINPALWRGGESTFESGLEIYILTCGDVRVDVSKRGGILLGIINPLPCNEAVYSVKDSLDKTRELLSAEGYENMRAIKISQSDFTAIFEFVPEVNGILLLTAKINVEICLSSGKITYYDAKEYVRHYRSDIHSANGIPEVGRLLPSNLTLTETLLCIADIDGSERLCCLAVCEFENDKVLVYIDYHSMKIVKTEI